MPNSKSKGNTYERDVCRDVSRWISNGERDDLVWRSASSGAVTTVHKGAKFKSQAGDIAAIDELAIPLMMLVTFEIKHYADLNVGNLIWQKPSKLVEFWKTHVELATKQSKIPLVVAKQDRRPPLLMVPKAFSEIFHQCAYTYVQSLDCVIYVFSDFLENVSYDEFIHSYLQLIALSSKEIDAS